MSRATPTRLWTMRAAYLSIVVWVIFFNLLPLETTPRVWTGPDILLGVTFAWALRRPEYVPMVSVALVFLLTDLLFQRPPGLLAALALIATEMLKSRARGLRDLPFMVEWLSVGVAMLAVAVSYRVILTLVLVPQAPLVLSVIQLAMSILAYPLIVLVTRLVFKVRRAGPGDIDAFGQRT